MGIAAGLLFSGVATGASQPCSLTPLWQFEVDDSAWILGGGVSDSAGNVYLSTFTNPSNGGDGSYDLISLDQDGNLRFRTQLVPDGGPWDSPDLAIIGGNVVARVYARIPRSAPAGQITLLAVRTEDGSVAWSRNMNADLQVPLSRLVARAPGQEGGKVAVPVATRDASGTYTGSLVAEYNAASGDLVRILQSPSLMDLTLVVDEQDNLFLGGPSFGGGLSSWTGAGALRFSESNWACSELIATASGFVVAGNTMGPFQVLSSNGVLLASTPHPFSSPLISESRFSYIERPGLPGDAYTTASLATMDLRTNRLLWRAFLGGSASESVEIVNPILTTARSVVFLQTNGFGATWQDAIREFDAAGNEYVTCSIPSLGQPEGGFNGFTIAGNRFVVSGSKTVLGFDAYGHKPAAKGWVMKGGGPEGQRRPR